MRLRQQERDSQSAHKSELVMSDHEMYDKTSALRVRRETQKNKIIRPSYRLSSRSNLR